MDSMDSGLQGPPRLHSFCCTEWELGFMICGAFSCLFSQLKSLKSSICKCCFHSPSTMYLNLTCLCKPYASTCLQHLRLPQSRPKEQVPGSPPGQRAGSSKQRLNCSRLLHVGIWLVAMDNLQVLTKKGVGQIESQNVPKEIVCESSIINPSVFCISCKEKTAKAETITVL